MRKKFKEWLYSFLETDVKDSLLADLHAAEDKVASLQKEVDRLNCYIDGLEYGIRSIRKIHIQVGGEVKKDGKS